MQKKGLELSLPIYASAVRRKPPPNPTGITWENGCCSGGNRPQA